MSDELKYEIAEECARRLQGVPGFSWEPATVRATAEDLMDWCKGVIIDGTIWSAEAQAHWIVKEVRMLSVKGWIGPGAMRQIFREKFQPETLRRPENQPFSNLGEKPMIVCTTCNDMGTIRQPNGRHRFCECASGEFNKTEFGNSWLDLCDGRRPVKTLKYPEPPPPEAIDQRPYPAVDEKSGRCVVCNGWGKIVGDYCACKLGRDLARVEQARADRVREIFGEKNEGPIQ